MLDHTYSPSDTPVEVERGFGRLDLDAQKAWASGLTPGNCMTMTCGRTFLLLAPDRGLAPGHWQVVYDHVETWAEALAIWSHLRIVPRMARVRAWPSEKLRSLPAPVKAAATAAMARQGWDLNMGDHEWTITLALGRKSSTTEAGNGQ